MSGINHRGKKKKIIKKFLFLRFFIYLCSEKIVL